MKKPEKQSFRALTIILAEWTGLEPATPGVTGRYSNQLNYHSALVCPESWAAKNGANNSMAQ